MSTPSPEPIANKDSERDELREAVESILHLNGCQQRTAGYNEAIDGKDLDTEDTERLEKLTLDEVMELIERHTVLARIDELERLDFKEASGFLSGGTSIIRQQVVTKRINQLTRNTKEQ